MEDVNLRGANITHVDFTGATVVRVDFTEATINGSSFIGATINGSDFVGATISGSDFTEAKMSSVDFYEVTLESVKNINFLGVKDVRLAKHPQIIEIVETPEIWRNSGPVMAIMPGSDQPLLISIWGETHTPEEWEAFTEDDLSGMLYKTQESNKAYMSKAVHLAKDLEKEYLENTGIKIYRQTHIPFPFPFPFPSVP